MCLGHPLRILFLVIKGNIIKPKEATTVPYVEFDSDPDSLWTLALTNPDGHFTDEDAEYLHWMVGNIKGSDIESGKVVCDYLQPFPPKGTGYHRYVFVLYKQVSRPTVQIIRWKIFPNLAFHWICRHYFQESEIDFSAYQRNPNSTSLEERTFSTKKFLADINGVGIYEYIALFILKIYPSFRTFLAKVLLLQENLYFKELTVMV